MDYAREKLGNAAYILATRFEELTTRLLYACREFAPVKAEDLPASLREDFVWISSRLDGDNGLEETLLPMGEEEAIQLAKAIWNLQSKLDRYMAEGNA